MSQVVSGSAVDESNWTLFLDTGHGNIEVRVKLSDLEGEPAAKIVNGPEAIVVDAERNGNELRLSMPHYDSELKLTINGKQMTGNWRKVRGAGNVAEMSAILKPSGEAEYDDPEPFLGRWAVQFADSDDPAVGAFERFKENLVLGTFLTTTGDYRYLQGYVQRGELHLSCFDGAHAFLFRAKLSSSGELAGRFMSGDWYQDSWTARRDPNIKLPDAFQQTTIAGQANLAKLAFPDLHGKQRFLGDSDLRGKVTLVEVFGSWCPNCHDEAQYLKDLRERYGEKGLKVVGLAFELTGDLERDTRQVKRYVERFDVDYPVLVAGISDKKTATKQFPVIDRIRSYPTTLFLDQSGQIRATYTGFSGPATGEAHKRLRQRFEALINKLLAE
ncbi:MAG: TlpA disulfide reductase family protein [Planctomycetota bacterium]|nr:TlpA disulfide reductase family protein [Planctomycetota bacterium]